MYAIRIGRDRTHLPGKFWTRPAAERCAADCSTHDSVDGEGSPVTYAVEELVRLPVLPDFCRRVSVWQEGRRLIEHPRRLQLPSAEQWQAIRAGFAVALEIAAGAGGVLLAVAIVTAKI